jgi:hypothetical protein
MGYSIFLTPTSMMASSDQSSEAKHQAIYSVNLLGSDSLGSHRGNDVQDSVTLHLFDRPRAPRTQSRIRAVLWNLRASRHGA